MTILHLAALGVVGFTIIGQLFAVLGTGIGLLFILGIGLVVLVGLVYALYGIAWFETQRVAGLYRLDQVTPLRVTPQAEPGFKGWLRSLGRQAIDGRMWRALASFGIASLMGVGVLGLAQWCVRSVISIFTDDSLWWQSIGAVSAVASAAGIVGVALLHRLITVAIVGAGANEEALTERAQVSALQREGAVRAADVERTRIERDLHDGVQPRLVSVAMTLGLAQQQIDTDPAAAKELIAEAHTSTKAAITELRQLARGIYASVLDDRGLDAALSALAARSHIPVQLDVRLPQRCGRDAEAAVYFAIAESLTNAAKHSRASQCRVVVRVREDGTLWARVEDNGIGGAKVAPGGGLDGVMNRVLAAGGTTRLDSPQGGPTSLEVSVPCAS
ncbi:MAG: histidine kinase [Leucobacter sp.]